MELVDDRVCSGRAAEQGSFGVPYVPLEQFPETIAFLSIFNAI